MRGRRVLTYAWSCVLLMGLHAAEHSTASLGNPPPPAGSKHPEGKFVSIGGHQIWIEIEGHGEPLLLVPGGPGYSHDYFHPFFSALSSEPRIIYYDPFGTGRSQRVADSPVSGAALQESNDRIVRLEQDLFPENWKRIEVLRSRGLVSSSPEMAKASPPILEYVTLYERKSADQPPPADAFNPDLSLAIMGNDMDFKLAGEAANFDWRPGLRRLNAPVLVLNGRADLLITPRQAEEISSAAPESKLRIFEHSGHFCFSEETDETMREIHAFLEPKYPIGIRCSLLLSHREARRWDRDSRSH